MTFEYTNQVDAMSPQWDLNALLPTPLPYTLEELETLEKTALSGGVVHRLILTAQYWHFVARHMAELEAGVRKALEELDEHSYLRTLHIAGDLRNLIGEPGWNSAKPTADTNSDQPLLHTDSSSPDTVGSQALSNHRTAPRARSSDAPCTELPRGERP